MKIAEATWLLTGDYACEIVPDYWQVIMYIYVSLYLTTQTQSWSWSHWADEQDQVPHVGWGATYANHNGINFTFYLTSMQSQYGIIV